MDSGAAMGGKNDFVERMRALNDAEQLLSACNIRGIIAGFRPQAELNRMILEEVRRRVSDDKAADGAKA